MSVNICAKCVHWHPYSPSLDGEYSEYDLGECSKIIEELDIEIDAGWTGGVVERIETYADFGCNLFSVKERD